MTNKIILAFVGMPGAGKSEAVSYIQQKGVPFVRFGQITEDGIKERGLPLTTENERLVRESIRKELGMGAYAIRAQQKIDELLSSHTVVAIDGLYSWEEYVFLKEAYPLLTLIHVYAEPEIRYRRLATRPIRPVAKENARNRDISELEKLNKGGPIAIADYLIENNSDDMTLLYSRIDEIIERLGVQLQ